MYHCTVGTKNHGATTTASDSLVFSEVLQSCSKKSHSTLKGFVGEEGMVRGIKRRFQTESIRRSRVEARELRLLLEAA